MGFGFRSLDLILMPLCRENLAGDISFDKKFGTLISTNFRSSEKSKNLVHNLFVSFPNY